MIDLVIKQDSNLGGNGSNYYDEELANALIEIWRIRSLMSTEQRDRILALTKEKFL
jgi:hypothetical protein